MGRKPSNVYDFFTRIEPAEGKNLVRYECKKCQKQYASNATRLADHLRQSGCSPSFQSNQRSANGATGAAAAAAVPAAVAGAAPAVAVASAPSAVNPVAVPAAAPISVPTHAGILEAAELAMDTDLLLRLSKTSTCAIADAMAEMQIQGHLVDVELVRGFENPLAVNVCGPALTVKVMPSGGASVKKLSFNYVDTAEVGQVLVVSAPEGSTSAVFGGLMATAAKARSVAAVVTDGRVRDVAELSSLGFPAFARGTSVHGQRGASAAVDVGVPVVVAGRVVRTADIIRADANGVVVIPAERAGDVAAKAELIEDQDQRIADAVQQGEPLQRSFQRFRPKMV